MNRLRILLAWLVVGTCAADVNLLSAAGPDEFVVMTWNLEWFYDEYDGDNYSKLAKEKSTPSRDRWNWRRDQVASAIAKASPSVVALQEVENRRVLWYLTRAIEKAGDQRYRELGIQSTDHFTEQDVGYLYGNSVDALSIVQRMQTQKMFESRRYQNLTKHLFAEFQISAGGATETVTMLNVHFRAGADNDSLRERQARLLHLWVADKVARGENVIVLGDFNTEQTGDALRPGSDLAIACGEETARKDDDLVDLTLRVPRSNRQTHLIGKQFDRILVSPSLLKDEPGKRDLVFQSIVVRDDLAVRGGRDSEAVHWDHYWDIPAAERDLSDHYPVIATFQLR